MRPRTGCITSPARPQLTGYRVLLENLYDCSANLHSGPGIGRGSSYNRLSATRERASERGLEVHTLTTDVSDPEQTRALTATAANVLGGLDALVNNAAVVEGLTRRPFDEIARQRRAPEPLTAHGMLTRNG